MHITRTPDGAQEAHPYMSLLVNSIGMKFKMRALDMHAGISLGGLEVQHLQYESK